MTTLHTLLQEKYGYMSSDFGPEDDRVFVDSHDGIISPGGLASHGRAVALSEILKCGNTLTIILFPGGFRARLVVVATNGEGLTAISPKGAIGFLSWEMLAVAFSRTSRVEIAEDGGEEDFPSHATGWVM
ncbi:MAG: hypothetical protein K2Q10_11055 [Rhodospirillales bacterium]|nr:hypothetical protein [Rhodospirillales bacterium]